MEYVKKRRLLFVDDEPLVLKGLERMLRSMRREWEMRFLSSAMEALELLEQQSFDAIISDMRMPGMDGAQLLTAVMKSQPDVVRIILSGQLDQKMALKTVRSAHQHLSKPCDAELIKSTLAQAFALRDILNNDNLKKLVSKIESLPSLPSLYMEIMEELQSANTSFRKVGEIIAHDVGMTAKILQMVNSAFFGLCRRISNPQEAVSLLGFETIKSLVLTAKIFSQFDKKKIVAFSLDELWTHSMLTGLFSKTISQAESDLDETSDDAYLAGLLHDLGKLVLAQNLSELYQKARTAAQNDQRTAWEVELDFFGTTHAEIAAYLMGLWGLNYPIVEAIAFHHSPDKRTGQTGPLAAVHAGNAMAHEIAAPKSIGRSGVDLDFMAELGLDDRVPVWQAACRELVKSGDVLNG
jgi:HD-like signal output (HDOD) protein